MPNVCYVTLGCAKNEVDTDRMRALLTRAGFGESQDTTDADVVLINTCSFLASATTESIETTLELASDVQDGVRNLPIVMCGCVPSRYGSELNTELPEVAAFVRTNEEDNIVSVVSSVLDLDVPSASSATADKNQGLTALRTVEGASAYLKISDGCNRMCSFCAIPYIRGTYASRPPQEIFDEATALLAGGVRELVLIGQDTGVWGQDLGSTPEGETLTLSWLLRKVAELARPYGAWVRVLYLQPKGMDDELIATLRDVDEVLPYIDIPIQHCNAQVLKAMRREGSTQEYRELFAQLRAQIPGMVLRSTALVGFPGETEEQFQELMDFLQETEFDYCSVFAYSPEDGTRAATLPDQVDDATKHEREQQALDLASELGFSATAQHVGERGLVLIDGVEEGPNGPELIGHAWFQAPDSDGAVHIEAGEAAVGDMVECEFIDSVCYELIGRIVK